MEKKKLEILDWKNKQLDLQPAANVNTLFAMK